MVVLKADAYGHGACRWPITALRSGATSSGVACLPRGRPARGRHPAPVLVLGYTPGWQAREAVGLGLTLTVFDLDTARAYGRAAQALDSTVTVHVKVDTGMHRLGVEVDGAADFVREIDGIEGLDVAGLFTHFACADDPSPVGVAATDAQLEAFTGSSPTSSRRATGRRWCTPRTAPACSAGTSRVRPGAPGHRRLRAAARARGGGGRLTAGAVVESQVAQVHDLGVGESVGYGHTWTADRPSRVATVPVGYADGLRRAPATWQHVLVRGRAAPLVGRVSMDQISIDVTDVDGVRRGDEVVLIGRQAVRCCRPPGWPNGWAPPRTKSCPRSWPGCHGQLTSEATPNRIYCSLRAFGSGPGAGAVEVRR